MISFALAKLIPKLRTGRTLDKVIRTLYVTSDGFVHKKPTESRQFLIPNLKLPIQPVRHRGATGIFNRRTGSEIWKAVTSVSNAGKKRGRGKTRGKGKIKDLNKGQIIGIGKANIRWPGLSAPVIRGREIVQQVQLPPDPEYQQNIEKLRDEMGSMKRQKLDPIDRGFSGGKLPGRRIGPPDPIGEYTFEGFDTVVLELKAVAHMTGQFGRYRNVLVHCMTGNGNGLVGLAKSTSIEGKNAVRRARNRAGQKLMYIERYNNHTVYHDFFTRFLNTKIYVWKKPEGYGLKCHRVIKAMCEIIGIKDLSAKIEGSVTTDHIIKSFLLGLLRQKTHKELSEETKLHVVEFSKEHGNYPKVVASPAAVKTDVDEPPDFNQYVFDGKIYIKKKPPPPAFTKFAGYPIVLRKKENIRNLDVIKRQLIAEYDDINSFLTKKYPECRPWYPPWSKKVKDAKKLAEAAAGSEAAV